jgi:hypothetical protein
MKTLKKTLCLVLALVMLFGLCAISSSAWVKYDDTAKFTNDTFKEAVDVLDGIGILTGYPDGNFQPAKNVTRAEAAKIITYITIGDGKRADALTADKQIYTDVPVNHWAAGYIQYCYAKNIINGMGDGTFNPDGQVTGLQFAKMLLCALGYGVNGEHTDKGWAINAAKDALNYGIFDDYLDGATNTPATREQVALYAFNTLFLEKVTYSALLGGYIQDIATNAESNKIGGTFAEDFKLEKVTADDDAFYRLSGHYWEVDGKRKTNDYDATGKLKGYWSVPVTGNDLYTAITADKVKDVNNGKLELNVFVNGFKLTDNEADDYFEANVTKKNTDELEGTGYGVMTYAYVTKTEVRIVIINTYLAKVKKVTAESKTADAATTVTLAEDVAGLGVRAFGETVDYANYTKNAYSKKINFSKLEWATEKFAKNDYVLVTFSGKVDLDEQGVDMALATTVTSKISKFTNVDKHARATMAGETYIEAYNDFVMADMTRASYMNKTYVNGDKYTAYIHEIDGAAYILGVDAVKAATDFVYVAQYGTKIDTSSKLGDVERLTAHVYHTDGTDEIVYVDTDDVAIDDYDRIFHTKVAEVERYLAGFGYEYNAFMDVWDAFILNTKKVLVDALNGKYNAAPGTGNGWAESGDGFTGLFVMDTDGDEATLMPLFYYAAITSIENSDPAYNDCNDAWMGDRTPTPVYKGISALRATINPAADNANVYADADTPFFYVNGEYGKKDFSVKVYTGIKNAPTVTADGAGLISYYAENDAGKYFAKVALVKGDTKDYSDKTVYFFQGRSTIVDTDEAYETTYDLYLDGKVVNDALSFSFSSWKKANVALELARRELTWHWVVEGSDTIEEALDMEANQFYATTKINGKWYTPYMVVSEVTGGTMYCDYADPNATDADHTYYGYELTADTKVVDIAADFFDRDAIESVDELSDFNFGDVLLAFSYTKSGDTKVVDCIYILDAREVNP